MAGQSQQKSKPTQLQQVLRALKALGKGTPKIIYTKIEKAYGPWETTKTPTASVSMYLSNNRGTLFRKKDGFWILESSRTQSKNHTPVKKPSVKSKDSGLYLITLSSNLKIPFPGFLFKIGESGDVKNRLIAYSACLPVETIHELYFYSVPININLKRIEKEVTGELLGNENLGDIFFKHKITIQRHHGGNQKEWLKTLDIDLSSKEDLNNLIKTIDVVVKNTIASTSSSSKEKSD
jgi:hypothetical protein